MRGGISLAPDESDYGAEIRIRGRTVRIRCDTPASARAVRRQVMALMGRAEGSAASAIGFGANLQDPDQVQPTEAWARNGRR
jgi:hypothetical protein